MKFRGFDPHTRLLRWSMFLAVLGIVLWVTAPDALRNASQWLTENHDSLSWYGTRVFGFLAYGALTLSVMYGLLLSTGVLDAVAHRAVSFALHQEMAAIGLALGALHGSLLALDRTVPTSVGQLLVPFAGDYRPAWVGMGQICFYLMAIVYFSFYARRRIGQRGWRAIHYTTFLVFVGATVHGLMAGSDSSSGWALWSYALATMVVVFLLGYRLTLASVSKSGRNAQPSRMPAPRSPARQAGSR